MHRFMSRLARLMAATGGAVLVALIALVCASVAGRMLNTALHGPIEAIAPGFAAWALALGIGPIDGDFELVEAGIAFAIFSFLPLCQITAGHATVDIFTARLSLSANRVLRMVTDIVFAAVLILIAVQLYDGMLSKQRYGETTFLLQFPVWWGYAASLIGAVGAALVAVYIAAVRVVELVTGRTLVADGPEADH